MKINSVLSGGCVEILSPAFLVQTTAPEHFRGGERLYRSTDIDIEGRLGSCSLEKKDVMPLLWHGFNVSYHNRNRRTSENMARALILTLRS